MHKVNTFIVGQPKSGTTALSSFLSQHPQVCVCNPKEVGFFSQDHWNESDEFHRRRLYFPIRNVDTYHELFSDRSKRILVDASTNYLYSTEAAQRIFEYNPNSKIIIMLRNPVDMMHSLHSQYLNEAKEDIPVFLEALDAESTRILGGNLPRNIALPSYLYYTKRANHYEQVSRYYEVFPRKNILIIIFEEFKKNNEAEFERLSDFLSLHKNTNITFSTVHGSKKPRVNLLNKYANNPFFKRTILKIFGLKLYTKISKFGAKILLKKSSRSPLPAETKKQLIHQHEEEVRLLSELIEKDLSKIWGYQQRD